MSYGPRSPSQGNHQAKEQGHANAGGLGHNSTGLLSVPGCTSKMLLQDQKIVPIGIAVLIGVAVRSVVEVLLPNQEIISIDNAVEIEVPSRDEHG